MNSPHFITKSIAMVAVKTEHVIGSTDTTLKKSVRYVGLATIDSAGVSGHSTKKNKVSKTQSMNSLVSINHGMYHMVKFVSIATNLSGFIKPAQKVQVPVITPLPSATATQAAPPTTSPVNTAAQKPASNVAVGPTKVNASLTQLPLNDLYAWGNCTWWVSIKRSQINDPIPNTWGNATNWAYGALHDGYLVDHNPTPGSIMQLPNVDYGLGHVAFVESVDPNGTWHISEMNVLGLDVTDNRAEPLSAAVNYNFIHDKK